MITRTILTSGQVLQHPSKLFTLAVLLLPWCFGVWFCGWARVSALRHQATLKSVTRAATTKYLEKQRGRFKDLSGSLQSLVGLALLLQILGDLWNFECQDILQSMPFQKRKTFFLAPNPL